MFVAAIGAALVFGLWFPGVYRDLAGGTQLFFLVAGIDVVLGPILTFIVFDLAKGWSELRRDLAVIGAIQISALLYGMHAVYGARPVAMVFEVDRFRVITANQVFSVEQAPDAYQHLPLTGPWLLGTRRPKPGAEQDEALSMGLQGVDIAQRPRFWQPYSESRSDVMAHAKPIARLFEKYPEISRHPGTQYVPLTGRTGDWVVLIDGAGNPTGFLHVNGFV